ncbi:MAG: electron transfer flavoprotein subunit alpha/FixB family protein [Eggerthellaceae bacterium]|nr:electron transfer flavoprotein subunit alpha/FixB family protein [Eggerthellaceae bacterium]
MSQVLVYGETAQQVAELAAAARSVDADAVAVALPGDADDASKTGVQKVLALEGVDTVEQAAEALARYALEGGFAGLMAANSVRGQTLAALVAGYADAPMDTDATKLSAKDGGWSIERLLFGGAAVREERMGGFAVATVCPGVFDALSENGASAPVEALAIGSPAGWRIVDEKPIERTGDDITKADRVLGIGMGFKSDDDLTLARRLAEALGAGLGGTRGIVEERHWLDDYIGISGLSIHPDLYVAAGISGSVQHTVGVRDAKVVVAINADKDAAMFKAADYGIVGDFREVAPLLIDALAS